MYTLEELLITLYNRSKTDTVPSPGRDPIDDRTNNSTILNNLENKHYKQHDIQ